MSKLLARAASLTILLLAVFLASRAIVRALPGDPLNTLIAETGTTIPVEELRAQLGLDRPFLASALEDLANAFRGDLGVSIISKEAVAPLLARRFLHTLGLASLAIALGAGASLALGLLAAAKPRSLVDRFCTAFGALAAALPTPWLGPMLMYLLAVRLPIFPAGDHVALPALTVAIGFTGLWSRLIRERVRETLQTGAAPGARARGLSEWRVVLKYGFMPSAGALVAYFGTSLGSLLTGAFVSEVIFDWPGMGALFVEAVLKRDYPVVEAAAFVGAATSLLGNALGDWAQSAIDPRIET